MKIVNIDREILHNFWTTWGISMKFSGKMCLMIILKVTKNQGFTLCLEDTIFKKPQGGSNWPPPAVLGLNSLPRKHLNSSQNSPEPFFQILFLLFSNLPCPKIDDSSCIAVLVLKLLQLALLFCVIDIVRQRRLYSASFLVRIEPKQPNYRLIIVTEKYMHTRCSQYSTFKMILDPKPLFSSLFERLPA